VPPRRPALRPSRCRLRAAHNDGKDYSNTYDAFGRLVEVNTRGGSPQLVAEYRYNGLGYRIGWHYDVSDGNDPPAPDGVVDSNDPWFHFCYDERWRIVATFIDSASSPIEALVHHAAGLDGQGGSSYIDSVILRDRNVSGDTDDLEERRYVCQNWRADVSAIVTDTGKMVEWVKYSAYGVAFGIPVGDTDGDGDWDATDNTNLSGNIDARCPPGLQPRRRHHRRRYHPRQLHHRWVPDSRTGRTLLHRRGESEGVCRV
jgi:YD repeat-containing protein